MPEQSIRFGISDGAGHRSATWKCWAPKGTGKHDIYLACRALGGALKTSLHESGEWHIAYLHQFYEDKVREEDKDNKGRFIEKWQRPKEISPGVTLAFRVVTPWSAIKTPFDESKFKRIHWIPNAIENKATEIDVLISNPGVPIIGWPGKRSMKTKLVNSMQLDSGETVWVVHWEIEMPIFDKKPINLRLYKGQTKEDLKGKDLRMLLLGEEVDGSRVLYDCALEVN